MYVCSDDIGRRQLVGISCFLANSYHGYQYDVHLRACLSCSFSFMSPTQAVVCDHAFLHALSDKSVETYTSRALQVGGVRIQTEMLRIVMYPKMIEFCGVKISPQLLITMSEGCGY